LNALRKRRIFMETMFPRLVEPGSIGNIRLKNRMIKAPQHTGLANPDGSVTDRMLRYYRDVASGGVSMVIVEYAWIDNDASRASPCQLGISSVDHLAGLSLLAQTLQANGAKAGLFLAEKGKEVIFVEMLDTFMNNITFDEKLVYEERFKKLKVSIHTGKRLESVSDQGITVVDRFGIRTPIKADTVVLAAGFRPNRDLIDSLRKDPKLQVFEAGDCVRPRKIFDAIHDGHLAAKLLG
jgi:NADH:flavin oxidoreductase / NADH oxidase family/Pyridine nucleotide-disulphide oxidoreductase